MPWAYLVYLIVQMLSIIAYFGLAIACFVVAALIHNWDLYELCLKVSNQCRYSDNYDDDLRLGLTIIAAVFGVFLTIVALIDLYIWNVVYRDRRYVKTVLNNPHSPYPRV